MQFLIYGADTFRSRKTLAAARDNFIAKRDATGMNVAVFRAAGADPDEVAEAVATSPFLAEKKLVILDGFLRSGKKIQERIGEAARVKPDSTVVIFFEDCAADEITDSPLFSKLRAEKFSVECAAPTPAVMVAEAKKIGADRDLSFALGALQNLLVLVGTDMWKLSAETEKLCAYAAAKSSAVITAEMVRLLASGDQEASIFAYLDACSARQPQRAAPLLEQLYEDGMAELQIISTLSRHIRSLLAVKDLMAQGIRDKNAVAKAAGIHPFVASKAMSAVRAFSEVELTARLGDLLELESSIKTSSSGKSRSALTLLSHKVAQGQR